MSRTLGKIRQIFRAFFNSLSQVHADRWRTEMADEQLARRTSSGVRK